MSKLVVIQLPGKQKAQRNRSWFRLTCFASALGALGLIAAGVWIMKLGVSIVESVGELVPLLSPFGVLIVAGALTRKEEAAAIEVFVGSIAVVAVGLICDAYLVFVGGVIDGQSGLGFLAISILQLVAALFVAGLATIHQGKKSKGMTAS